MNENTQFEKRITKMNDTVQEFETWYIEQRSMFPNSTFAMTAYCEETGEDFDNLYDLYYEGVIDEA